MRLACQSPLGSESVVWVRLLLHQLGSARGESRFGQSGHLRAVPLTGTDRRSVAPNLMSDMSSRQKTWLLVAASVQLLLAATAWVNLAKRPATEVTGPKAMWAALIAVNFVGPLAYFAFGRRRASLRSFR